MTSSLLTRNASRDDNNIGTGQSLLEAVIFGQIAGHGLSALARSLENMEPVAYGGRGNVREVSSDTRGVDHVVQSELCDIGV